MSKQNAIRFWGEEPASGPLLKVSQPVEITELAQQLTSREKSQIIAAYQGGSYELATSFIWGRAMVALKRSLREQGITFLAELLGRVEVEEEDSILDAITEKEVVKLTAELGIVSWADAQGLRRAQELAAHFSQSNAADDVGTMETAEAENVLVTCVSSVLVRSEIKVARGFSDFRSKLETGAFTPAEAKTLAVAPYFYQRLALAILLAGVRSQTGDKLQHILANLITLLPILWAKLREPERWQVGAAYAQVYADGLQTQTTGLKQALLKVRGFDYVSDSASALAFQKAAEALIRAHESVNNFFTEEAPTKALEKLGPAIPASAVGTCLTALLCVRLGHNYGECWAASPIAERQLKAQSPDTWTFYLNEVFPSEVRLLEKLSESKPQSHWLALAPHVFGKLGAIKDKSVRDLVAATLNKDPKKIAAAAQRLIADYYGKSVKNC